MIRGILTILIIISIYQRVFKPDLQTQTPSFKSNLNSVLLRLRRPSMAVKNFGTRNPVLTCIFLLISGDIETNPGPQQKIYPCGICEQNVSWQCKGICCDNCGIWFHHSCVNVNSREYSLLGRSNVSWKCCRCDSMNVDSFTFNSYEISFHNSFAPLAHQDERSSIDSLSSNEPFSPVHTSSPRKRSSNSSPNQNRTNHQNSQSRPRNKTNSSQSHNSSVFSLPTRSNLRVLNVNCCKISNKVAEFHAALQYIKPDIVMGTESWLTGIKPGKNPTTDSIANSEIFPKDYEVFRNDRNSFGGGVFILTHKSLTVEEKPELCSNCEINWVKIKLQNLKDLFVGVFYMPHRNMQDALELQKSLNLLTSDGSKDRNIIIAGDFNCPDINWDDNTIKPNASDGPVQRSIINITSEALLTQVHNQPTRLENLLDLTFTSNPTLLKSSTSVPGISDHDMVVSDFDTKPQIRKQEKRKTLKFNKAKWDEIEKDMIETGNSIKTLYDEGKSVQELWDLFKLSLQESIKRNIPSVSPKSRGKLPWITKPILKLLKMKQKLYRQAKATKIWTSYKKHQKHCKHEIRRAEWKYLNQIITNGLEEKNNKPFWNFVKSKKKDNSGVAPLKSNGKLYNDPKSKASILLNQFKSVFTKEDTTPPPPHKTYYHHSRRCIKITEKLEGPQGSWT